MDGIEKARREEIITGQQAGLLKRYINGNTRELKGATLLAFNKLDDEAKRGILNQRRLNERSAEAVPLDNSQSQAKQTEEPQASICGLDAVLEKNKNSGRIDGYGIGRLKKLLNGVIKKPDGVPLKDFNKLDGESKIACFKLYPDFRNRALKATGIGENACDEELIGALCARENFETLAGEIAGNLKKSPQMRSAFSKLDNETQALLTSDCDPISKLEAIEAKFEEGTIGENEKKFLQMLVQIGQVCQDKKIGFVSGREAGLVKKYAQGFARTIQDGSATAKAFSKLSQEAQMAFNYKQLEKRSAKVDKDAARKARARMLARPVKITQTQIIQNATEFISHLWHSTEGWKQSSRIHTRLIEALIFREILLKLQQHEARTNDNRWQNCTQEQLQRGHGVREIFS